MTKNQIKFDGFSQKVRDFFIELKTNNNKEWFDAHKDFYTNEIKDVSKLLVAEMSEFFISGGLPFIADPKISLFRINRDIRFSANKDPYKTNMGVFFPFSKHPLSNRNVDKPGLYFHLDDTETFIAGGIHCPMPDTLKKTRERIAEDNQELNRIVNDSSFLSEFSSTLHGDILKKVPRGFPQDHPAAELLKMKEYLVSCELSFKDSNSRKLLELIQRKAIAIAPFLEYFYDAIYE